MFVRVRATLPAIGLVVIAALAVLSRALRHGTPAVDFAPVWLAGVMWNAGADPYGTDFATYAHRLFPPPAHLPVSWVYPAQWMLPARLLALLSYDQAKAAWLLLSIAALAMAILLLWRAADRLARPPSMTMQAGAIVFLLTMEATGGALYLGQTTFLMLLGIAMVLHGLASERPVEATVGLILLLLKPQFGIVFTATAIAVPSLRRPALAAITCTGLLCLAGHAVSPLGAVQSIAAWLGALASYNDNPFNAPAALTGLGLIVSYITSGISPLFYTGLAAVAAPLLMRWLRQHARLSPLEAMWLAGVIILVVVVPLHNYDLSFAAIYLFLLPLFTRPGLILLAAGMVLLHRAQMIGRIVAPDIDILRSQAAVATLGAALLLAALLASAIMRPRPAS